jgi:hypothetical protein
MHSVTTKNAFLAVIKRSERSKEGKRKIGGQKGSKREFKKKFSEEEIDKFCDLKLDSCPACENKNLKSIAESEVKVDQNTELLARIIHQTCRLQKRNPWEFINQSYQAYCFGGNYPSLLAT